MEKDTVSLPPAWPLAMVLTACYLLIAICGQYFLINDNLYYVSLSGQMTEKQINELLTISKQWFWLGYVLLGIIFNIKILFVSAILATGYYLLNSTWKFRPFLRIAFLAEFVFLLSAVVKIYWFGWLNPNYSLSELQNFVPLSLSNLLKLDTADAWLNYPLQVISAFEAVYYLVLIMGVHQLLQLPWKQAVQLVSFSYLPALLIWVVLVMFISISSS